MNNEKNKIWWVIIYPLEANEAANRKEEERCLEETEKLIKSWHMPVAGLIVEPVQAEGYFI